MKPPMWFKPFVALIVLLTGAIPVFLYLWVFSQASMVSADSALNMLNDPTENAILIDVRAMDEFSEMHIAGSYSWTATDIASLSSLDHMPSNFKGRTLFLICNSGFQSAQAAKKLQDLGVKKLYYVRGGIQKWVEISTAQPGIPYTQFTYAQQSASLYKAMPMFEQVAAVISGFGFKPLHMILSAVLAFILLKQKAFDLRIFGWGMLIFLTAETFCAINYIFYNHDSYLAEYLHSYGMTLAFGFAIFAIMHGLDERLIKFSAPDKHCTFLPLCRGCVKYNQTACKMSKFFQLGAGAVAILAFIPLLAKPVNTSYATQIFGSSYHYCRLLLGQYFESRYLPLVVLIFCVGALLTMQTNKETPAPLLARIFLVGAIGALGFSIFRLMLGAVYSNDLIWADFWEEITELMFVALAAIALWIYRDSLLDIPISKEMFSNKTK